MRPFFFGGEPLLFGVHHPPLGPARGVGVVIAHPLPQEFMRTAWALRRLAAALALDGYHVLRFDYRGTGDSSGDLPAASLADWATDLGRAVTELRSLSEGLPIAVVGVRWGGGLALTAPGLALRELVLWEPVLDGRAHLEQLRAWHRQRHGAPVDGELLGHPWTAALNRELTAFDARRSPAGRARRISVLQHPTAERVDLPPEVQRVAVAEAAISSREADLNTSLLAPGALRAIAEQLARPLP